MTRPVPFPVTFVSSYADCPRIGNECLEISLHDFRTSCVALLRELVEAGVPATAHVEFTAAGRVRLISVQASDSVDA